MSQLTADTNLTFEADGINSLPIKASTEIFRGSAVGVTGGYARQLTAGDPFVGFAEAHTNNNIATDGAKTIPVKYKGQVQLAITSAAVTDIGKAVYASDGNTYTFTATSNSYVGKVIRFVSTGVVIVAFNTGKNSGSGVVPAITDSTGGTGSATFAAITAGATYAQADIVAIKNALSEIATVLNALSQAGS